MGGGLMQLVAYGAQDIYLTGNPQITFFKVVYRRHTNFSMELIKQAVDGTSTIKDGTPGNGDVTISRNGDLINDMYVVMNNAEVHYADNIVQQVDLEIGGQLIDRHTLEWNQIWLELTTPFSKVPSLTSMLGGGGRVKKAREPGKRVQNAVFFPLQFWFCLNPGLALPLIALQYHEVKLKFTWGHDWSYNRNTEEGTCEVWGNYIYLDTDERRRFAQVSHEYLITQVQSISGATGNNHTAEGGDLSIDLTFNHPVKELIWSYPGSFFTDITLKLNGHERFAEQPEEYFKMTQVYKYHTKNPNNYHISQITSETLDFTTVPSIFDADQYPPNATYADITKAIFTATQNNGLNDSNIVVFDNGTLVVSNSAPDSNKFKRGDTIEIKTGGTSKFTALVVHTRPIKDKDKDKDLLFIISHRFDLSPTGIEKGNTVEVIIHHGVSPMGNAQITAMHKAVGIYSFALKPEEHQPSGTCNFSRIDSAILKGKYCTLNDSEETITVYAVNYNVLRIMSGMGGLAYSN